jgi:hypothetical protein
MEQNSSQNQQQGNRGGAANSVNQQGENNRQSEDLTKRHTDHDEGNTFNGELGANLGKDLPLDGSKEQQNPESERG